MKDVRSGDKAVSPIIATILLIAITVVLAATLISILSTFTNSTHLENIDSSLSLSGVQNSTENNCYYLNVSSTSASPSLSQIFIEIFDGSREVYDGSLSNHTGKNVTIIANMGTFSAGNYIQLKLSGKYNKITTVELIYASSVFATVTPL
ncbi:MAG: archaellin/type IV pilin N-terminal domain-containing protein [Cuniculiplasma sp.]